ncbi:hypothetical protein AgCh_011334 [Apium graveolens]
MTCYSPEYFEPQSPEDYQKRDCKSGGCIQMKPMQCSDVDFPMFGISMTIDSPDNNRYHSNSHMHFSGLFLLKNLVEKVKIKRYSLKNSLLETVKEGDVREKLEGLQGHIEKGKKLRAEKGATTYSDQSQPKTTTNHHTLLDIPAKNHHHRS